MDYEETLNAIHARKTFSKGGPTLERITRLMDRLGNPQENYKTVHIAGTNGKGSTAALIAEALQLNGYKTGLFTSPYLVDFRERIEINRVPVSVEQLISAFEKVNREEAALEKTGYEPVNEFEFVAALGFLVFAEQNVDYAVIEVGLGGRTDPTNILKKPECCCIMPISLDHTAILGDTIEKIAGEKAGIIKSGVPVVTARQVPEAKYVFREKAQEKNAPLIETRNPKQVTCTRDGGTFLYDGKMLHTALLGQYQTDNAAAAWEVCKILGLNETKVNQAFSQVVWEGRLQLVHGERDILIDSGHNPDGVTSLMNAVKDLFPDVPVTAVMVMMRDKAYDFCVPMVAKYAKNFIGTTVPLPRAMTPEDICGVAEPYCPTIPADCMEDALRKAVEITEENGLIVVCGSVFAAGEAVKLTRKNP